MRSKLADTARRELLARVWHLTPEQRLEAFLRHSRAMAELRRAGREAESRAAAGSGP